MERAPAAAAAAAFEGGVALEPELLVDLRLSLLAEIRLELLLALDFALVLEGCAAPLDRLRFLITSVFRLKGRTTP
jgi:hypothetical protein